jgi:putative acyl-CoA dehydrogenase
MVRIGTILGKYWICKRSAGHAVEAMECIGGSGLMEDSIMPRLFRESPVNAVWEGSGNVQGLDLLRVMQKEPGVIKAYFSELDKAADRNALYDAAVRELKNQLSDTRELEFRCRTVLGNMAVALQAALLIQHSPDEVAHAFCASRLARPAPHLYGELPSELNYPAIIDRAFPRL